MLIIPHVSGYGIFSLLSFSSIFFFPCFFSAFDLMKSEPRLQPKFWEYARLLEFLSQVQFQYDS